MTATIADGAVTITPNSETKRARAMWGTTRALVNNMVTGVSTGFTRNLEINGVGYRAAVQGKHPEPAARLQPRCHLTRSRRTSRSPASGRPLIAISGADRQRVGQVAAEIRALPPARALQGQGHQVRGRDGPPQGRQEEVGRRWRTNQTTLFRAAPATGALQAAPGGEGAAAAVGVPLVAAHLCAGHRRRGRAHAGRGLDARCRRSRRSLKTGADKAAAQRGRQAARRARQGGRASRRSCSTAAAISFMAGSRPWPTPPARAASISRRGV